MVDYNDDIIVIMVLEPLLFILDFYCGWLNLDYYYIL